MTQNLINKYYVGRENSFCRVPYKVINIGDQIKRIKASDELLSMIIKFNHHEHAEDFKSEIIRQFNIDISQYNVDWIQFKGNSCVCLVNAKGYALPVNIKDRIINQAKGYLYTDTILH